MGRAENLGCGVGQLPNRSSIDFMRLSPRSYTSAATSSQSGWLMTSFARRFVLAMMQVTTSPPESGQGDTVEYPDRNSSNFTSKSGRSQQVRSDEHTPRLSVFPPAPDMRHNDHFVQRIRSARLCSIFGTVPQRSVASWNRRCRVFEMESVGGCRQ